MLALTPPPDRAIPVLWQNFIRTFNVPGRLDTVPSAHSRSLASVRFLPQTRTPLRVGAKCGRPHRGSNRALTTGTSVGFRRFIHSATEGEANGLTKMMGKYSFFCFYGLIGLRLADHILLMTIAAMKAVQGETNSTTKNMALIGKLSEALRWRDSA